MSEASAHLLTRSRRSLAWPYRASAGSWPTVYRITDGADVDWASFYAQRLTRHSELGEVLGGVPVRSQSVHELVECDRAYGEAGPEEPWEPWYARRVVERFG